MNRFVALSTAGIALTLTVALTSCSSATKTESTSSTSTTSTASPSTAAPSSPAAAANRTIKDYLAENQIVQTPIQPGEPGAPVITLPALPDWSDLSAEQTTVAGGVPPYAAKGYDSATGSERPVIQLRLAKLTGNVDFQQLLDLAPADAQNAPGFTFVTQPGPTTPGGFDGVAFSGTLPQDGQNFATASRFIVIPVADPSTTYIVRLNGTAPESDQGVLTDAMGIVDTGMTIEPG